MPLKTTLELSIALDANRFYKLFHKANPIGDYDGYDDDSNYVDQSISHKGIFVKYKNKIYKKKITLIVDTDKAIGNANFDPDILINKLEKRIAKYFNSKYQLNDFSLTGMTISTDVNVHSREMVDAYMKLMHRLGRVKGYSKSSRNPFSDDVSFWLEGNSNFIEFIVLDIEGVLKEQLEGNEYKKKQIELIQKNTVGLLHVEVRLTKAKAVRSFTDGAIPSLQIVKLLRKSQDIYCDFFFSVVPFGDSYKQSKTIELIREKVDDQRLRRKMIRLVELIPEKKSLLLAQKALDYRRIDEVMEMFADIELSPVTISKRSDEKKLDNLIKYI